MLFFHVKIYIFFPNSAKRIRIPGARKYKISKNTPDLLPGQHRIILKQSNNWIISPHGYQPADWTWLVAICICGDYQQGRLETLRWKSFRIWNYPVIAENVIPSRKTERLSSHVHVLLSVIVQRSKSWTRESKPQLIVNSRRMWNCQTVTSPALSISHSFY